jgi:hypothetical protein
LPFPNLQKEDTMFVSITEAVEDQRLLEQVLREQEADAACALNPVNLKTCNDHAPDADSGGVTFQKCGGGRRIIRKKIGGGN